MISPGPFGETNRRFQSRYDEVASRDILAGKLERYDEEWAVHLTAPVGDIVMVELADVLRRFEGKTVVLSIRETS